MPSTGTSAPTGALVRTGSVFEVRPLLIFPCNGNGIEALDALDAWQVQGSPRVDAPPWRMHAFIDDTAHKQAQGSHGWPVLDRAALAQPVHGIECAVLAVPGSPTSFRERRALIEGLGVADARWARVIHPGAHVSPRARIGRNVLLMAGVVVSGNAVIGDHVCVLPNTVIGHDTVVGSWSLLGANVTLAGHVVIEDNAYIASGTSVRDGLRIGEQALVGLGSTVVRDVAAGAIVAGSPARSLGGQPLFQPSPRTSASGRAGRGAARTACAQEAIR